MSEKEIEKQMELAIKKVPFEVKKIKFVLAISKKLYMIKKLFK